MTDQAQPAAPNLPNIIVILVDDMGFSDIGCYGSEIETPHLDGLAENGIRFTHMYNCARCCPTRASLLTGLYPHQAGVGGMTQDQGVPGYRGFLSNSCVTIAEALKARGYATAMSGKWHVGGHYFPNKPETWTPAAPGYPTPRQRGFDAFFGTVSGGGSYFRPPTLMGNDKLIEPYGDVFYYTDAISENAVAMIQDSGSHGTPFFLYVAYTAPHWPLHALEEDIARFEGRYHDGWDAIRTRRHEEQKGMGLLDPKWEISPRDAQAPPWEEAEHKDWQDRRMAVYAAQVYAIDRGVGRIMAKLRELGMADNTLVLFLSDNGGCAEFLAEDVDKPNKFRYNIPTRDGGPVHVGNTPALMPGPETTFMSYELPWANASNAPFRRFKKWVHEGGIATPLIAHWPAAVRESSLVHHPAHVIDIMATCLDAAGAAYPKELNGSAITPLEGVSFLPAIRGETWAPVRPIFWEHMGNRAVRQGRWKLVSEHGRPWELYDMVEDRTELSDLAKANRPKAQELEALYQTWAKRCHVLTPETLKQMASQRQS